MRGAFCFFFTALPLAHGIETGGKPARTCISQSPSRKDHERSAISHPALECPNTGSGVIGFNTPDFIAHILFCEPLPCSIFVWYSPANYPFFGFFPVILTAPTKRHGLRGLCL